MGHTPIENSLPEAWYSSDTFGKSELLNVNEIRDKTQERLKLSYMNKLAKVFGDEQNFQGVLSFYKDIVGVGFDPSQGMSKVFGRGYGVFTA